ncbi:hypothetical protein GWK47_012454 [Chionoecetes opilio]|uniref:Uncharacterized protein n=1 Tax=Chionoecetes opilio TaxID=41210 RepID=A0A8J4XZC8_CHIOP|nr:hypothetical protein GWK47_012454 [Chionoecetes opilio]
MTQLTSLRPGRDFRSFDGGEVVEIHLDPGPQSAQVYTTGKGAPPKGEWDPSHKGVHLPVGVYGARPSLPLCSVLGAIGSATPSTPAGLRCDAPGAAGLPHAGKTTYLPRAPFRCFQCGGPHGPRSAHCTFNCRAQQLYADLAREGTPLHAINTQLRDLDLPSLPALRRPKPIPNQACTSCTYSTPSYGGPPRYVVFRHRHGNRYGPLQEARKMMPPCLRLPSSTLNPGQHSSSCAPSHPPA